MLKRGLWLICLMLLFSGCAGNTKFAYDYPTEKPEQSSATAVAIMAPLKDKRSGDKKVDIIFSEKPVLSIQKIVGKELIDTGLFKQVITMPSDDKVETFLAKDNSDIVVYTELKRMEWFVPDYKSIVATAFAAGFLTGGLGGLAYGATSTDVIGNSELHVRVVERSTERELVNKTYTGTYKESMAKLRCDTPDTKAKMIGKSLKDAISQLKADLNTHLESDKSADFSQLGISH